MTQQKAGTGTMKGWPEGERPRERFQQRGPAALSDAELVAILLRSGGRGKSALDIGRELLDHHRSLRSLARASVRELTGMKGVGEAKAVQLLAAFELGRRLASAADDDVPIISGPADVARRMIPVLRDRRNEVFTVLMLDARNALRAEVEITRGTLTASLVHPREVYKAAIEHLAASIIVVHNHPSGNAEPSADDVAVTRQLAETGSVVGIPLHDHVIIAGGSFVSLAERGLLQ